MKFRKRLDINHIDNFTIHKLPLRMYSFPEKQRKINLLRNAQKAIENYIKKHAKPDLIFHHGVFDYCYLTNYIRSVFELPVWYMEHSSFLSKNAFPCANSFDSMATQKEFVRNADRRFAVTDAYVDKMAHLFELPFEYCPNVITDDFFIDPSAIQKPENTFQFINVALLNKNKNQKLILDAFAKKFKGQTKFKLLIAGDGALFESLKKQAKDLGISNQCQILGFQSRKRILELLDESHCFVLSSHAETFGVVIIEAMARGLPAISSRIDGPTEIINNQNGTFFVPDNADDLAEKMLNMVENYNTFNPELIIDSVKERFGPDAVKNALFPNA
ncbi:glycosyltransferase family 4 protein [Cryomorpha ignava]|uniref:Glycosyltransferase family 4 protein n=1 Tax=Cryomorpha ignava TaxID=101383 RepID=A0A7K3WRA2_9FLAO|nr:glycosyltransferase [Cryomorpha ignava]NEN24058.1 glycosyltransferase family 4 protein [Cryomorpha ignava]